MTKLIYPNLKVNLQMAIFILSMLLGQSLLAQVPQKLNYQGIARDMKGNPLGNQSMTIKISILPTDDATVAEYEETQNITTNEFGLYSLQIGNGIALVGEMKTVKWETGNKYIRVAIDKDGGNNFVILGTSQLLSVPYAIYADKAGLARETINQDNKTRTGNVTSSATHVAGDANYLTKFTGLNVVGKSTIFDNGTNVGIGTASPSWPLHLRKTGPTYLTVQSDADNSTAAIRLQDVNGTGSELGISKFGFNQTGTFMGVSRRGMGVINNLTGPFLFNVGGYCLFGQTVGQNQLVRMMIDSATGYIGIGNTISAPPTAILQVNKAADPTIKISNSNSGTTANDGLDISLSGNNAIVNNKENGSLSLRANNAEALFIGNTGNIGIGHNSPGVKLDVLGQVKINDGTQGLGKVLTSDGFGLASWQNIGVGGIPWMQTGNNLYNTNTNNVGISTINPLMKLHIAGNTDKSLLMENTNPLALQSKLGLFFKHSNYYNGGLKIIGNGAASSRLGLFTGNFSTADSLRERITITSGGNVGIGDTSPAYALEVNGTISTNSYLYASGISCSGNLYNNYQENYGDSYVDGYFDVDGNVDFASNLHVSGTTTNDGNLNVGGTIDVTGEVTVSNGNGIVKSNSGTQLRMGFSSGSVAASVGAGGSVNATFNVTPFTGTNSNIRVSVSQFQPDAGSGNGYKQFIMTPHDVNAANNTVVIDFYNAGSSTASFDGVLYLLCVATD